jgi:t-SNARE complex subunit (syntaxin)
VWTSTSTPTHISNGITEASNKTFYFLVVIVVVVIVVVVVVVGIATE